jgi:hypothetical protein
VVVSMGGWTVKGRRAERLTTFFPCLLAALGVGGGGTNGFGGSGGIVFPAGEAPFDVSADAFEGSGAGGTGGTFMGCHQRMKRVVIHPKRRPFRAAAIGTSTAASTRSPAVRA